ncbi:endonuclease/exonuclease/phosphatase family protein [Breoghania sp. L-A4]|uniref:endonuclease/exonuclease/phosphatase family protein n=1 Tax=Breoghania sp. L-A4 TaxID=2304600 RepID=UPI000E35F238|nr:endonuclease/exonuclease/phosphatase family protein [Breoghania sp. L-A4]AXS42278.1 endonuclease [Breoghania sp. L-A4]
MRFATFNLESFGDDTLNDAALAPRIARLRPVLERLAADVVCLQEVNAQRVPGRPGRGFAALDALLEGTDYAGFHRACGVAEGAAPAERHNLVVLSRYRVIASRAIRHDHVPPPQWHAGTGDAVRDPGGPEARMGDETDPGITFDRPILAVELDAPGRHLHVFNVHLRAPIAAPVAGQKLSATRWKSVSGWAEGYYLAAMKRVGQALELRQAIETVFERDLEAWVLAAGDFNAVTVESALRIVAANVEDTGNLELSPRVMTPVETQIPRQRRYTVLHHGRRHMLDHILASPALLGALGTVEVLNEGLADEMDDSGTEAELGSFHAPLVAGFRI